MVWENNLAGHWPEPQFAGHLAEGNLGLYDFRARHYDPDAGQFLQVDPFVPDPYEPADLNAYGYVRNDPVNLTDPTGECVELITCTIVGFIIGAIVQGVAIHKRRQPRVVPRQAAQHAARGRRTGGSSLPGGGGAGSVGRDEDGRPGERAMPGWTGRLRSRAGRGRNR